MKGRTHLNLPMTDMYGDEYVEQNNLDYLIDSLSILAIITLYGMITIIVLSYVLAEEEPDSDKKLK